MIKYCILFYCFHFSHFVAQVSNAINSCPTWQYLCGIHRKYYIASTKHPSQIISYLKKKIKKKYINQIDRAQPRRRSSEHRWDDRNFDIPPPLSLSLSTVRSLYLNTNSDAYTSIRGPLVIIPTNWTPSPFQSSKLGELSETRGCWSLFLQITRDPRSASVHLAVYVGDPRMRIMYVDVGKKGMGGGNGRLVWEGGV